MINIYDVAFKNIDKMQECTLYRCMYVVVENMMSVHQQISGIGAMAYMEPNGMSENLQIK